MARTMGAERARQAFGYKHRIYHAPISIEDEAEEFVVEIARCVILP